MLTPQHWIFLFCILLITVGGGYLPLFKKEKVGEEAEFPIGESFTSGVFLALSLTIMLPAGSHLLRISFPKFNYPLGSLVAIIAFLFLLSLEHITIHLKEEEEHGDERRSSPVIPIIMTVMIAVPSFFLGTALGISDASDAIFIFVAIMAHKGTAGFALALKMVKSSLTRKQIYALFCLFAFATPVGIFVGADLHEFLSGPTMKIVKGIILSLAAGTFLYLGSLHELRKTPLIKNCCSFKGFFAMLAGLVITAIIRFVLGEAHHH